MKQKQPSIIKAVLVKLKFSSWRQTTAVNQGCQALGVLLSLQSMVSGSPEEILLRLFVRNLFLLSSILGHIVTTWVIRPHREKIFRLSWFMSFFERCPTGAKKVRILGNTVTVNQMPENYNRLEFRVHSRLKEWYFFKARFCVLPKI